MNSKTMNQEVTNKCLHCDSQLPLRVNSTICRNCRFKGHKEFGNCSKCSQKYNIDQLSTELSRHSKRII